LIVPDVNLLLYAHVNAFPEHARARRWWEGLLNGSREVGIASPVLFGFLRISTSLRVLHPPMSVPDAVSRAESWLSRPHVHFVVPGPRHLDVAFDLLRRAGAGGDLTTDVQLAALAIELHGEVHSNDGDFGRFPGLRWVNPIGGG
jgi:toxin-antitoxin system PIN domain toxin